MTKMVILYFSFLICIIIGFNTVYADSIPMIVQLCQADTNDSFGGNIEAAGDFNGDGFNDIWISQSYFSGFYSGRTTLFLYYGGNPMDTIPDMVINDTFATIINVGLINDDEFDDFIIPWYKGGIKFYGLHYGGPSFNIIPAKKFLVHHPDKINMGIQGSVSGGFDMDGDGKNDLLLGEPGQGIGYTGSAYFYGSYPELDTIYDLQFIGPGEYPAYFDYGMAVEFINNLDGADYVAISQSGSGGSYNTFGQVFLYKCGFEFDTIPEYIINTPWPDTFTNHIFGDNISNPGDIDDDGYSDIIIGTLASSNAYIFLGGNPFNTEYDYQVVPTLDFHEVIGDVNNDSYPDLMGGQGVFSGIAWILYGGPDVDGIFDMAVDRPSGITQFGRAFKGLGDVDGDNIDDFAVAGLLNVPDYFPGVVTVFSGYDGEPTPVEEDGAVILPDNYKLYQNHPNPFNSSTVIEFEIPAKQKIELAIYNVLGEKIRTLIDGTLPPGQHKVVWDGLNGESESLPSGIYIYRLIAKTFDINKKMILLK